MRLFFDMDGVLAKFYADKDCITKMVNKGYYYNLKPYKQTKFFNELNANHEVFIVSACIDTPYCMEEKTAWLREYAPNFNGVVIYTKVGESKAEAVKNFLKIPALSSRDVLIDDFTVNLHEWAVKGGTPIKFLNGVNGKKGTNHKYKYRTIKQLSKILAGLYGEG